MSDLSASGRWADDDLRRLSDLRELQISVPLASGEHGPWTPIWVVVVDGGVYVRTWRRRETGWYGRARRLAAARIRLAGAVIDVVVTASAVERAAGIDAAYRAKYGEAGARSMVTDEAAASTLRLTPKA